MEANETFVNCSGAFSYHERVEALSGFAAGATVSLIACICTLSLAIYLRLYKWFSHRLGIYLICTVTATSIIHISQLLSLVDPRVCLVFGSLRRYSLWVELLFTSWFTFHIFCLTILQRNFEYLERFTFSLLYWFH